MSEEPRSNLPCRADFTHPLARYMEVTLDGRPVERVIWYDQDKGIVAHYRLNSKGDFIYTKHRDSLRVKKSHGEIGVSLSAAYPR